MFAAISLHALAPVCAASVRLPHAIGTVTIGLAKVSRKAEPTGMRTLVLWTASGGPSERSLPQSPAAP